MLACLDRPGLIVFLLYKLFMVLSTNAKVFLLLPHTFLPSLYFCIPFFSPLPSLCSATKQLAQTQKGPLNYTVLNSVTTQCHKWGSKSPSVPGCPYRVQKGCLSLSSLGWFLPFYVCSVYACTILCTFTEKNNKSSDHCIGNILMPWDTKKDWKSWGKEGESSISIGIFYASLIFFMFFFNLCFLCFLRVFLYLEKSCHYLL